MSGPAPSGEWAPCVRCRQPLPVGTATCLYCGAAQPVASGGAGFAMRGGSQPGPVISGVPAGLAPPPYTPPGSVATSPPAPPPPRPEPSRDIPAPPRVRRVIDRDALGPAFAGTPAAVGPRLGAFTVDMAAVAVVAAGVALVSRSVAVTILVVAEALALLWLLQARTGAGLGKLLFRLRVSRTDEPRSPGKRRAFVRGAVTAAGGLVAGAGAWVVEASSAWGDDPRRRSWADRASGTVVVAVPTARTADAVEPMRLVEVAPPVVTVAAVTVAEAPAVAGRAGAGAGLPAVGAGERREEALVAVSATDAGIEPPPPFEGIEPPPAYVPAAPPTTGDDDRVPTAPPASRDEDPEPPPYLPPAEASPAAPPPYPGAASWPATTVDPAVARGAVPPPSPADDLDEPLRRATRPEPSPEPGPRRRGSGIQTPAAPTPGGLLGPVDPAVAAGAGARESALDRSGAGRTSAAPGGRPVETGSRAADAPGPRRRPAPDEPATVEGSGRAAGDATDGDLRHAAAEGDIRAAARTAADDSAGPRRRPAPDGPPTDSPDRDEPGAPAGILLLTVDTGQRETLTVPGAVNLGRNPIAFEPTDLLVRVEDPAQSVSRTHARLEYAADGVWIVDNGSTNGTELVDEQGHAVRLEPAVRTAVEDGSRIRLGERLLTLARMTGSIS